ncbi:hypothetical protein FIBSPDRAFT_996298 [Athelia psychrophila]|uniref:Uncharacterized protein n=1 Tax=Athelia psychrophila TaxID=1759441 RepID=A0A165X0F5_9AGAM|nr:hypothetical protein FIBSPDRAFT_996298 [Fibularhizoctonia sp. CBS 109695]
MTSTNENILVLGAGELGTPILRELATRWANSDITLLVRPATLATTDAQKRSELDAFHSLGIHFLPGDLVSSSVPELAALFKAYHTVIGAVGYVAGPGTQLKLAHAVLQAGNPEDVSKKYAVVFAGGKGVAWDMRDTFNFRRGIPVIAGQGGANSIATPNLEPDRLRWRLSVTNNPNILRAAERGTSDPRYSAPRPLAHIPSIPIFDPLEFDTFLPSSQYTVIKTDDLKTMYREIGRVQAYLHNLIKRGDDTPSLAIDDSKQAKPAAIERVPPEILSMIFEQAVPPQTDDEDPRETHRLAEILLPGQICRLWREAAIATPSLWSSLHFNFSFPMNSVEKMVDIATTCIARAKSYPLSVCLRTDRDTELKQYRPIIAVLLAHSHQWDNLFINSSLGLRKNVHEEIQGATGHLPSCAD